MIRLVKKRELETNNTELHIVVQIGEAENALEAPGLVKTSQGTHS